MRRQFPFNRMPGIFAIMVYIFFNSNNLHSMIQFSERMHRQCSAVEFECSCMHFKSRNMFFISNINVHIINFDQRFIIRKKITNNHIEFALLQLPHAGVARGGRWCRLAVLYIYLICSDHLVFIPKEQLFILNSFKYEFYHFFIGIQGMEMGVFVKCV